MSLNNLDDFFEEVSRDNVVDQIQHERETSQAWSTSHDLQGWQRQRHQRRKRDRSSLQVILQPRLSSEVKQKVCTVHKLDSLIQREENYVSKSLKTPFLSKASTVSSTKERIHLLSSLQKCAAIADFSSQQEVPFMNSNVGTDNCNERYDHAEAVSKTGDDDGYENQHKVFKGVQRQTSTSASQSAVKLAATSCLHDLNKDYLDDAERSCLTTCASDLPWKKVLWRKQGRPDNFTDSSFLQELVVNASVPVRKYPQVVLASAAITQQICTVVASMSVAAHLAYSSISVPRMLWACAGLLVAGYLVCALLGRHLLGGSVIRGMRQCCLLVGGVYCLSPLLHSLARTVSEDSVIALTALLLLIHVFLHDYNFVNNVTDTLSGAVSLSTALYAAVLVASLMPTELHVFTQVLFSLELFLLGPYARRYVLQYSQAAHVTFTLVMSITSTTLLWTLSPVLSALLVLSLVFVTFICPWWLVSIHKFKAQINGPWDEAVPHISAQLRDSVATE